MSRSLVMIFLSFFGCLAHLLLSVPLEILNAKIDFLMVTIVLLAVFSELWYPPVLCALFSGLAVDLATQAGTFVNTGVYLAFAAILGLTFSLLKEKQFLLSGLIVFGCVAIKHLFFSFLLYMMRLSETATLATFWHGVPSAIYSGTFTLAAFFLYQKIFSLPFMHLKNGDEKRVFIEKN